MKNIEKANELFEQAWNEMHNLNFDKAIDLLFEADHQGHDEALCYAGYSYQFIKGDIKKAIELYIEAINHGSANAKFLLGNCYYDGIGVEQDTLKGCQLRNEALREGSGLAHGWFLKITDQFPK